MPPWTAPTRWSTWRARPAWPPPWRTPRATSKGIRPPRSGSWTAAADWGSGGWCSPPPERRWARSTRSTKRSCRSRSLPTAPASWPGRPTAGPSPHKKNAVPNFIKRSLKGEPIVIYGDGSQTRDFIFVEDLCDAIRRALAADAIGGEVFQVATGIETSIADVAKLAQEVTGSTAEIRFEPKRSGEVYRSRADISKARRVLGFDPRVPLPDGLARVAAWYREHWLPAQHAHP